MCWVRMFGYSVCPPLYHRNLAPKTLSVEFLFQTNHIFNVHCTFCVGLAEYFISDLAEAILNSLGAPVGLFLEGFLQLSLNSLY